MIKQTRIQSVQEALNEKRRELRGKVRALVLCKRELFYGTEGPGGVTTYPSGVNDTVYPVSPQQAAREAKYFGVEFQEM